MEGTAYVCYQVDGVSTSPWAGYKSQRAFLCYGGREPAQHKRFPSFRSRVRPLLMVLIMQSSDRSNWYKTVCRPADLSHPQSTNFERHTHIPKDDHHRHGQPQIRVCPRNYTQDGRFEGVMGRPDVGSIARSVLHGADLEGLHHYEDLVRAARNI